MSRLVYRKGMNLVAGILPEICGRHEDVRFIIGGDGPKRKLLDEVCDMHNLHKQVDLLNVLNGVLVYDTGHVNTVPWYFLV